MAEEKDKTDETGGEETAEKKPRAPLPAFLKGLIAAAAAAAVVGAGLGLAFVDFTSSHEAVCRTCHADEAALWESSQVHPPEHSSCASCHESDNGAHMTGEYAADPGSITRNCLSCHEDQKELEECQSHLIKLSHKVHAGKEGLRCTDCHWNIAHDRYDHPTYRPTKWSCYACHEHVQEIDGEVSKKNCERCHYHLPDAPAAAAGDGEKGGN
jgi:hypothetical protein